MDNKEVAEVAKVRQVSLYCLAIFDPSNGDSRVFTFNCTKHLLDAWSVWSDSSYFPYTFTKTMYITPGHPLYDVAEDVVVSHSVLKIKK